MKRKIRYAISGAVIVFLVFVYAHISKCNPIYDTDVDSSRYNNILIYNVESVKQKFVSKEDVLDAVKIKSRVTGDVSDITIKFSLRDLKKDEEIAKGEVKGKDFKDSKFTEFKFERIEDCRGKEYEISLVSIGQNGNGTVDFCYENSVEEKTAMYVDDKPKRGTLILKTVTNRFDWETFFVLMIFIIYIIGFMKLLYKLFK